MFIENDTSKNTTFTPRDFSAISLNDTSTSRETNPIFPSRNKPRKSPGSSQKPGKKTVLSTNVRNIRLYDIYK